VGEGLKRLKITYKKSLRYPKASDAARTLFPKAGSSLVFIDESGSLRMMRHAPTAMLLRGKDGFGKNDRGAKGRTNAISARLCKTLLTISL
jgi:hypothetical protein